MTLHGKNLTQNVHFVYAFVVSVVSRNEVFDIRFFKLKPFLYNKIQSMKQDYFNMFNDVSWF